MKKMKKTKIIISLCVMLSLLLFSGCFKSKRKTSYSLNLEIWGIFDDSEVYSKNFRAYREINPFVKEIKYRKLEIGSYKRDLINAMAAGTGPDIFFIQNSWLPEFMDKVVPAPVWIINEQEFRNNFVDVVIDDFFYEGNIYGSPLSVDSLALYYNKDIFNAEGIATPPKTWEELERYSQKITRLDNFGNVVRQGVALGTAYNINRSVDILNLIMLQQGAVLSDRERKEVVLRDGEKAMDYYIQYARSDSPLYTWNPRLHYSMDAFCEGTLGMMLNYSWHYETVRNKNPKLNFAVAPIPQVPGRQPVNHANYWAMVVAKNKPNNSAQNQALSNDVRIHEAWELIKYLTLKNNGKFKIIHAKELLNCLAAKKNDCLKGNVMEKPLNIDPAANYIAEAAKPAARRDLLEKQMNDPILGPFAIGNLIAKSWYQPEAAATETILAEAINSVNNGVATSGAALSLAASRINQLVNKNKL